MPIFGLRQLSTEDYHVDAYKQQRWMCPNCGLIFDYHELSPEELGWPELNYDDLIEVDDYGDQYMVEGKPRELCSRCGVDFSEHPLLSVKVSPYVLGTFTKLTFVVEDRAQESVISRIAQELNKDVEIVVAGDASNVERYFNLARVQGTLANGYFLVDGDNKSNPYLGEPHFIQLDKYCIENYLLDFEIHASISNRTVHEIRTIILNVIQKHFRGKDSLLNLLFSQLSEIDLTDTSLSNVDASVIFTELLKRLSLNRDSFIEKYVARCRELSKLEMVLPSRIVEVIKNA